MYKLWMIMPIVSAIWLFAISIKDFREKSYAQAGVSFVLALGLLLVPIPAQSHTVDIDLQGSES